MRRTLVLTSPHMHGLDVRFAQNLLATNRFRNFHPGKPDGDYGETTAAAARRAKWELGYEKRNVNGSFGTKLERFLTGKTKLSPLMRIRRKRRLAAAAKTNNLKVRALNIALAEASKHVVERPVNHTPYGRWYGFDGVPWCAIFVSYCFAHAGDRHGLRTALAYQWEYWARSHAHGLSITSNPSPGDIVVYHHGEGHTGIFRRWTNRAAGQFEAVEGNTSKSGSQDNGGAVEIQQRDTGWVHTVFVHVSN